MAPKVTITVALNQKPALEGLQILVKKFKDSATSINQSLELLGKGWSAITGVVGAATDAIAGWTKAAMEAEKAEQKAIAGLALRGGATQKNIDALKAFNNTLQQKGVADADDLLGLQAKLSAYGVMPGKLQDATKATLGLSEATGRGLAQSARKVAAAFSKGDGSEKGLIELFALAEAQAGSLEAKFKTLSSNFGDIEETLGSAFTSSGVLKGALDGVNTAMGALTEYFSSEKGKEAVNGFFSTIIEYGADVIDVFAQIIQGVDDMWDRLKIRLADLRGDDWVITESDGENRIASILRKAAGDFRRSARTRGVEPGVAPPSGGRAGAGLGGTKKPKGLDGLSEEAKLFLAAGGRESEEERKAFEAQLKIDAERAKQRADQADDLETQRRIIEIDRETGHHAFMQQLQQKQHDEKLAATKQFYGAMVGTTVGGLSDLFAQSIAQAASGTLELDKLFGQFIVSIGTMLIQLGTAAVAANLLSFIPFLAPLVGAPGVGIGAGAAAIAAGALMVGLGSAMGGGSAASVAGARVGSGPRPASSTAPSVAGIPAGFVPGQTGGSVGNTYVVNLNGPVVGGSPAAIGQQLWGYLSKADRLRMGNQRFGFSGAR